MRSASKGFWKTALGVTTLLLGMTCWHGCTPEQADAVLAGLQVATDQLDNNNEEVSLRDWLSSELDD